MDDDDCMECDDDDDDLEYIGDARKITDKVVNAFINGQRFKSGNDFTDGTTMTLHGNEIAKKEGNEVWITNAGWATKTTKERLNGIPGVSIQQKAGTWYLNGKPWDGEWIKVDIDA